MPEFLNMGPCPTSNRLADAAPYLGDDAGRRCLRQEATNRRRAAVAWTGRESPARVIAVRHPRRQGDLAPINRSTRSPIPLGRSTLGRIASAVISTSAAPTWNSSVPTSHHCPGMSDATTGCARKSYGNLPTAPSRNSPPKRSSSSANRAAIIRPPATTIGQSSPMNSCISTLHLMRVREVEIDAPTRCRT